MPKARTIVKIVHPGQQALIDLIPYKGYRRMILGELCGKLGEHGSITVSRVNRVFKDASYTHPPITKATEKQRKQIVAYVNRVLRLLDI